MGRYRTYCESTCEASQRIEISYLRRHNLLEPAWRRTLSWNVGGRTEGSIGIVTTESGIHLRYRLTLGDGTKTDVDEFVPFATSRTNFGGIRHWLTCLHRRRRVGVLYGGQYFRCRTCHGLHYSSQYEPFYERVVNEADKLRARVGGSRGAFDEDPFPEKPKRMRWATYNRLQARYDHLVNGYQTEFMRVFGSGS